MITYPSLRDYLGSPTLTGVDARGVEGVVDEEEDVVKGKTNCHNCKWVNRFISRLSLKCKKEENRGIHVPVAPDTSRRRNS